jgi:hypothetical protein
MGVRWLLFDAAGDWWLTSHAPCRLQAALKQAFVGGASVHKNGAQPARSRGQRLVRGWLPRMVLRL